MSWRTWRKRESDEKAADPGRHHPRAGSGAAGAAAHRTEDDHRQRDRYRPPAPGGVRLRHHPGQLAEVASLVPGGTRRRTIPWHWAKGSPRTSASPAARGAWNGQWSRGRRRATGRSTAPSTAAPPAAWATP